ncbi:MAG: hypothetical protein QXZ44_06625 [Ferroplasma sp.]
MEPFYFRSYDKVIGSARNVEELYALMVKIEKTDPASLSYHLKSGHISAWLAYINKKQLANKLKKTTDTTMAISIVGDYLSKHNKNKALNK